MPALELQRKVELRPQRHQMPDRMLHLEPSAAVNGIERNRRVVLAPQDVRDRRRHESARAHLEEDAIAVRIHLLHGLAETHRLRPASCRLLARGPQP